MTRSSFVFALFVAAAGSALAAAPDSPTSVVDLLNRLPKLPATAEEAGTWFARDGKLAHPGLVALKADIEAHRKTVGALLESHGAVNQAQGAATADDLAKGMANVGIDMARMKTDPAYAKDVQARMKTMSPADLIAMSQQMARPMNQDPRLQNQAQLMASDSPAVQAAAEAAVAYGNEQNERIQSHIALWAESDKAANTILAKVIAPPAPMPRIEFDNPGCEAGCQQQWNTYATKMIPLLLARDTEALAALRPAFEKDRASVAAALQPIQAHLTATQYGAAAKSQVNQARIVGYDTSALNEIDMLVQRMEDIVKRTGARAQCGTRSVLVPGAVCR